MSTTDQQTPPILTLPHGPHTLSIHAYNPSDPTATTSQSQHLNNRAVWERLRNMIPFPYTPSDAVSWAAICADPANHVGSGPWTPSPVDPATGTQTGYGTSTGPRLPTAYAIYIDGESVGGIGLRFGQDVEFRTAELGYWLGEAYWGRGVMSVLVPAFVRWSFATFGVLVRLDAGAYDTNLKSGRVLVKAGFREEGRRLECVVKEGVLMGQVSYGCLRRYVEG